MTTLHSTVTIETYAEVLRLAEIIERQTRERAEKLGAVFQAREARHPAAYGDPAIASGIRRRTTAYQAKREQATFDRDIDAYKAARAAERAHTVAQSRLEHLRHVAPVPYTEAEWKAAVAVRLDEGWHKVLKVNRTTVGVEAGFPWPHKVARARVLEVRGPKPEAMS